MNKMFRITDLLKICINNIFYIASGAILGGLSLYIISAFILHPRYISSAELYVFNPNNLINVSGIDAYDLAAAQKMTSTYITILNSDTIIDQVNEKLMETYSTDELIEQMWLEAKHGKRYLTNKAIRKCIKIQNVDSTEVIQIMVETKSPILSMEICQWLLEFSSEQIPKIIGKGSVKDVGGVSFPMEPSSPKLWINTLSGAVIGGFFAVIVVFAAGYFDNKITTREKLTEKMKAIILGEIPEM